MAETDVQSIAALYTATLVGLLQSWLHYGMKHDEEQFVERVTRLTEGTLRYALERSCGGRRRERLLEMRPVRGGAGPAGAPAGSGDPRSL